MISSDSRKAEFAERLLRHQSQIFGFIYSLVRNLADADDLFQQTGLVLWAKYDQFDSSKSFVAWACGVARLEASNFLRARNRERRYFSDELNVLLIEAHAEIEQESPEEWRDALAECMKKLQQRDQELLQTCYGGEARIPEVARSLDRSTQSIHNSLRRIRRAMSECVHRRIDAGRIA
jgi:RNA polymerase sigma-70 factor (ECF subfamily)